MNGLPGELNLFFFLPGNEIILFLYHTHIAHLNKPMTCEIIILPLILGICDPAGLHYGISRKSQILKNSVIVCTWKPDLHSFKMMHYTVMFPKENSWYGAIKVAKTGNLNFKLMKNGKFCLVKNETCLGVNKKTTKKIPWQPGPFRWRAHRWVAWRV